MANTDLTARLAKAKAKIKDLDSFSRRDNLLITGLPSSFAEMIVAQDTGRRAVESS